jgi:hypothetical protein
MIDVMERECKNLEFEGEVNTPEMCDSNLW